MVVEKNQIIPHQSLKIVDLSWNQITPYSAAAAEAVSLIQTSLYPVVAAAAAEQADQTSLLLSLLAVEFQTTMIQLASDLELGLGQVVSAQTD